MRKRNPSGCQSLDRGIAILRRLTIEGAAGMRLIDVQQASGLTRPTVHRILGALSRHGLVEQQFETRRYRVSQETSLINSGYGRWAEGLRRSCKDALTDAANELGDTLILLARSDSLTVCVDRYSGPYPEQPLTVEIGTRRPLGVGAGGIAILSAFDDALAVKILETLRPELATYPNATLKMLKIAVRAARRAGFAFSDGYVRSNVRAVAVPILNDWKLPVGALSVVAVYDRIKPESLPRIAAVLGRYRGIIERLIPLGDDPWGQSPAISLLADAAVR